MSLKCFHNKVLDKLSIKANDFHLFIRVFSPRNCWLARNLICKFEGHCHWHRLVHITGKTLSPFIPFQLRLCNNDILGSVGFNGLKIQSLTIILMLISLASVY